MGEVGDPQRAGRGLALWELLVDRMHGLELGCPPSQQDAFRTQRVWALGSGVGAVWLSKCLIGHLGLFPGAGLAERVPRRLIASVPLPCSLKVTSSSGPPLRDQKLQAWPQDSLFYRLQ